VLFLLPWYVFAVSNSIAASLTSSSAFSIFYSSVSIFSPCSWTYLAASLYKTLTSCIVSSI
jgi:hypothetical protein